MALFFLRARTSALTNHSFALTNHVFALRFLSFTTHLQSQQPPNPNATQIPESISASRLLLHNKVLKLLRQDDLDQAADFTRHSLYSNCRPTIFTVNAVLAALMRRRRYSDLMSLHRFVLQAGVAPNIVTHNLLLAAYCHTQKVSAAWHHFQQVFKDAPFCCPSPTTYRILVKGIVDDGGEVGRGLELKDDMLRRGVMLDAKVYSFLMEGCVRSQDADGAFRLYEELREKLGEDGVVEDGVVYGSLMKACLLKGMVEEAKDWYEVAVGEDSNVRMSMDAYNSVLGVLVEMEEFDEALRLFDRMMVEHNPPRKLTVSSGSFLIVVDAYCELGKCREAVEVFRRMGEKRCSLDTETFNSLIEKLCSKDMVAEGEELFGDMLEKGLQPDEQTYFLLADACFKADRADDAAEYCREMIASGFEENLAMYRKIAKELVQAGKVDDAKSFFDTMVKKFRMDSTCYEFIMKALSDSGKLNDVLNIVNGMLEDNVDVLDEDMKEFVIQLLRKEGKEEELEKLIQEKQILKTAAKAKELEAAERNKESIRAAVASLTASTTSQYTSLETAA